MSSARARRHRRRRRRAVRDGRHPHRGAGGPAPAHHDRGRLHLRLRRAVDRRPAAVRQRVLAVRRPHGLGPGRVAHPAGAQLAAGRRLPDQDPRPDLLDLRPGRPDRPADRPGHRSAPSPAVGRRGRGLAVGVRRRRHRRPLGAVAVRRDAARADARDERADRRARRDARGRAQHRADLDVDRLRPAEADPHLPLHAHRHRRPRLRPVQRADLPQRLPGGRLRARPPSSGAWSGSIVVVPLAARAAVRGPAQRPAVPRVAAAVAGAVRRADLAVRGVRDRGPVDAERWASFVAFLAVATAVRQRRVHADRPDRRPRWCRTGCGPRASPWSASTSSCRVPSSARCSPG